MNESSSPGVTEEENGRGNPDCCVHIGEIERLRNQVRSARSWFDQLADSRDPDTAAFAEQVRQSLWVDASAPHDPLLAEVEGLRRENELLRRVVKAAEKGFARSQCGSCDAGLPMNCTCNEMDDALAALSPLDGTGDKK